MKSFFKKQNKNGFGIVEVIVATGIIMVGIIPIIMLFNQNLKNEIKNKNILIATYLANESIEIIRQERDDNWSASNGWMENISTDGSKIITVLDNVNNIKRGWDVVTPTNDEYEKVYLADEGFYAQLNNNAPGNWKETGFERYLTVNTGTAGCFLAGVDCVEITSYVLFGGTEIVEITAYLYNGWK